MHEMHAMNCRTHDMQPCILQNQDLRNSPFVHYGTKKITAQK
jgi:hypothetical protein